MPIRVPLLPPNNETYSQAVRLGGILFLSGQLGVDPTTRELVLGGIEAETRQALQNVSTILKACGSGLDRVVKVNIFLADFTLLGAMNRIYAEHFPHRPAKTTVEVSRLDRGALIEIEAIAAAGSRVG